MGSPQRGTTSNGETFDLLTYTQGRREITGSPWFAVSGSLVDARRKVKQDLVDDPGLPDIVFLPSEVQAAGLRAAHMADRLEDITVTLVCNVIYIGSKGVLRVESVPYSQLAGRIVELHEQVVGGTVKVWIAYSEETKQVFWLNDFEIDEPPRLPGYDQKYDKKRTGFRSPSSGVNP